MKLVMVGIIVEDMDRAMEFYKCLGLEIDKRYGNDYVELKNSSIRISLNTKTMIENVYGFIPDLIGERIELAFELDTMEELDNLFKNMQNNSYDIFKSPWLAPWNQYYGLIKDIDGNILSLFVNLEES